jgi:hypothetical protein
MFDTTIKYFKYEDNKCIFELGDYDLATRSGMDEIFFRFYMKKKFNAIIEYPCVGDSNIYFEKEKDIKKAIKFLQPRIDAFWVAIKLGV